MAVETAGLPSDAAWRAFFDVATRAAAHLVSRVAFASRAADTERARAVRAIESEVRARLLKHATGAAIFWTNTVADVTVFAGATSRLVLVALGVMVAELHAIDRRLFAGHFQPSVERQEGQRRSSP